MQLKANYDLVLPNNQKVKIGEVFDFEGDISSFKECVSVISEDKPKKETKTPEQELEEKAIREKAHLLGIKNWHTKGVAKLVEEIKEKEEATTPAPAPASTPAHEGDDETEETDETEGNDNV